MSLLRVHRGAGRVGRRQEVQFKTTLLHWREALGKVARGTKCQFESARNAEFFEEVVAMRLDCLFADKESLGNLFVGEAGADVVENVDLFFGQMNVVMFVGVAA